MSDGQELIIREAVPEDAEALQTYLHAVRQESDLLLVTDEDLANDRQLQALALADIFESNNNILLVAILHDEIIGMVRISAEADEHIQHVGTLGISVRKAYWNHQIGTMLLGDALDWAQETNVLKRIELTVQVRNERAIHVYKKFGFVVEGQLQHAFYTTTAGYLDVLLMAKLLA
ncbi:GNAT family N-acetyltransferase [Agrilactobacillus fermenti]|uniref:GNAT family N-acetyltransferase n=1 Tax=Agrilactobacillus fermenti TaxID=2586909 RepID=UPI001E35C6E4|nr:GNAT family protein [Agrilactobacillus fermenti]MCD2257529.1 GNAT family N-acetyltransferase [Agrilactobacillus fermenti]